MPDETIVPDPRSNPVVQQNINPVVADASGGLTGYAKVIGNMSAVVFVMVVTWVVLSWMHESIQYERTNNTRLRENQDKLWDSINTTNHAVAGVQNSMAEQTVILRALKDQVERINIQRGMPKGAGLQPGAPAPPP